ncbi:cobalamin biosynthesis protein [Nocardia sp. NPDC055053]
MSVELVVGLGLRPGVAGERIVVAVRDVVGDARVSCLATLDRRACETGVRAAAEELGAVVRGFTAAELAAVDVPHPSARIAEAVRTASVAEAAALLVGGRRLTHPKRIVDSIVIAATETAI